MEKPFTLYYLVKLFDKRRYARDFLRGKLHVNRLSPPGARDPGRRLSVNAIRRIIRSRAAAVGIEGRVSDHSLRVGGAQVAVTGDAGPLCTGPVGSTGRRRSRPLRSRIKPGSTVATIFPAEGGGDPRPLVRFSR